MKNKQRIEILTQEFKEIHAKLQNTKWELERWRYYALRYDVAEIINRRNSPSIRILFSKAN